jgi:hypothetical protein
MSREGPLNFGKPLLYLTIVGVIAGGIYLWKTWPSTFEGNGWKVDFPNRWETTPYPDPSNPLNERHASKGPLAEEGMEGVAWVTVNRHGTLDWPRFAIECLPGTPDKTDPDNEIDHKRAMLFEYQDDKNFRYTGAAVQRGDAIVIVAIGAPVPLFETNRERLEKCAKSLRTWR